MGKWAYPMIKYYKCLIMGHSFFFLIICAKCSDGVSKCKSNRWNVCMWNECQSKWLKKMSLYAYV